MTVSRNWHRSTAFVGPRGLATAVIADAVHDAQNGRGRKQSDAQKFLRSAAFDWWTDRTALGPRDIARIRAAAGVKVREE